MRVRLSTSGRGTLAAFLLTATLAVQVLAVSGLPNSGYDVGGNCAIDAILNNDYSLSPFNQCCKDGCSLIHNPTTDLQGFGDCNYKCLLVWLKIQTPN